MPRTAGRFRHRLLIQKPVMVLDETTGERVPDWQPVIEVWADIMPLRGKEALTGEQILADMNTRIVVRWSPILEEVTAAHRGLHQNTIYNFVSLAHINLDRREIEIMAKSGANDG